MSEQGYSLASIHRRVLLAACFSRWLKQKGVGLRSICSDHLVRYLRYRARHLRPCHGDDAALRHLIGFLRREGLIPGEKKSTCQLTPAEYCAQAFGQYLLEERALAHTTIINYVPFIRSFLEDRGFGPGRVALLPFCASDVAVRFVQRQAPRLHMKRAKPATTALRSFLNYGRYLGEVSLDLAAAVPIVANWSMTSIPRAISAEHVRQLLASIGIGVLPWSGVETTLSCSCSRDWGCVRAKWHFSELDDIDWNAGQVSVRGKGGQRNTMPLPIEVGRAIAAYLRRGRPATDSRRVFLRAKAPICAFRGASGVGSLVRHSLERAGIHATTKGTHQFRHGLATEMLRQGAALGEIAEFGLGIAIHRLRRSTPRST